MGFVKSLIFKNPLGEFGLAGLPKTRLSNAPPERPLRDRAAKARRPWSDHCKEDARLTPSNAKGVKRCAQALD